MSARTRSAALALATGVAFAPVAYAAARLFERAAGPEPDPAAIIWAERSAFLGRWLVAGFASALATAGFVALAGNTPGNTPGNALARTRALFAAVCALAVAASLAAGALR